MEKLLLALILLFRFTNLFSQSPDCLWAKSVGGIGEDAVNSIALDPSSGDIYTTGFFSETVDFDPGDGIVNLTSKGNDDIFISRSDPSGNFIWAKAIGGTGYDGARSISVDPTNGNIYITGKFEGLVDFNPDLAGFLYLTSGGSSAAFISKFDSDGNLIWAKAFGKSGDGNISDGNSIAVDIAGSEEVYVTGYFKGTIDFDPGTGIHNLTSAGNFDIFISKLNAAGQFVWATAIGGTGYDTGYAIEVDPSGSGGILVSGTFEDTSDFDPGVEIFNLFSLGFEDIFILKLDPSGNFVWAKQIGGTDWDQVVSLTLDPAGSGDIYTIGVFVGTTDFDPGAETFNLSGSGINTFISKLDSSGNFVWAKSIGGGLVIGYSVAIDPSASGNIYYTGGFYGSEVDMDPGGELYNLSSVGSFDIFISKLDSTGAFEWVKTFGGSGEEYGQSIAIDPIGHVYIGGYYDSPSILFDTILLTNSDDKGENAEQFFAKLDTSLLIPVVELNPPQITIYPNPATDELTIEFDKKEFRNFQIEIYNIIGEMVFSGKGQKIEQGKSIDMHALVSGIYFIKVDTEGYSLVKKIVKK